MWVTLSHEATCEVVTTQAMRAIGGEIGEYFRLSHGNSFNSYRLPRERTFRNLGSFAKLASRCNARLQH
jgi:hypothetical protein